MLVVDLLVPIVLNSQKMKVGIFLYGIQETIIIKSSDVLTFELHFELHLL